MNNNIYLYTKECFKVIDYRLFGIKPSKIISSLCYSILRLEPYYGCTYNCIYCYANWYRSPKPLITPAKYLYYWEKIASQISQLEYKPFFRLSTLSEPFQEALEKKYMMSYKILEIAYKYKIPIIINTKSTLLTENPWIEILERMAKGNKVLVQVSLNLTDKYTYLMEPNAPPARKRLELIRILSEKNIPVVLRLQPLIPGFEEEHLRILNESLMYGVKGVIVEPLRATSELIHRISSIKGVEYEEYFSRYKWRKYSPEAKNLYVPGDDWWFELLRNIQGILVKYSSNIPLSICKYKPLKTSSFDCCLFYLTGSKYGLRITLRELLFSIKENENIHYYDENDYVLLPSVIRKIFKIHHRKLIKTVSDKEFLREFLG